MGWKSSPISAFSPPICTSSRAITTTSTRTGYNINAEIGYALTSHIELFASEVNYASADGQTITGSKLVVDSPLNPFPFALGFPFTSHFNNYSVLWRGVGGSFLFHSPEARIRPLCRSLRRRDLGGLHWPDREE